MLTLFIIFLVFLLSIWNTIKICKILNKFRSEDIDL